jgi:hypothetical protein
MRTPPCQLYRGVLERGDDGPSAPLQRGGIRACEHDTDEHRVRVGEQYVVRGDLCEWRQGRVRWEGVQRGVAEANEEYWGDVDRRDTDRGHSHRSRCTQGDWRAT